MILSVLWSFALFNLFDRKTFTGIADQTLGSSNGKCLCSGRLLRRFGNSTSTLKCTFELFQVSLIYVFISTAKTQSNSNVDNGELHFSIKFNQSVNYRFIICAKTLTVHFKWKNAVIFVHFVMSNEMGLCRQKSVVPIWSMAIFKAMMSC